MRVARVFTICAALISTFAVSETVRSNRQLQPPAKDDQGKIKPENPINVSEITFTTLRPQMAPPRQRTYLTVYAGSHKTYIKLQPSRQMVLKPRGRNRFKVNRRRRQLQPGRLEKSYKLKQNHVESHQIETMQGPAEAFDEGAIHIEPIYRVTKNKNILDMIADIFRRMIDPQKSIGPLVGPFNFPGVGQKVYIRLLESVQPDNLLIRLITTSPVAENEPPFEKNVLPSSEAIEQDAPLIDHEFLLPKHELISSHDQRSSVHSDSLSSFSNNVAKVSNPGRPSDRLKVGSKSVRFWRPVQGLGTYKLNLEQGDSRGIQRDVAQNQRHPPLLSAANDYVHSGPRFQLVNKTRDGPRFRATGLRDLFHPANASSTQEAARFKSFFSPEIVPSPKVPLPNSQLFYLKSNFSEPAVGGPKYSIGFASEKMKYLNMDGSVEPAIEDSSEKRLEGVELGPIFTNRSIDRQWTPITGVNNYTSEGIATFGGKTDANWEERTSGKKKRDSGAVMAVQPQGMAVNKSGIALETRGSSCCSLNKEASDSSKSSFDEQRRGTSSAINSTSNANNALGTESIVNPMLQLLQLHRVERILNSTETKRI